MKNKIIIGSDHGGYLLKSKLIEYLKQHDYEIIDAGTYTEDSCDYPLIAQKVAKEIINDKTLQGILLCGTGIGMSIAANKIKGIRAAVVSDTTSARLAKEHNNANILCIGARIVGEELAKDIVNNWLNATFLEARHLKRISMIE